MNRAILLTFLWSMSASIGWAQEIVTPAEATSAVTTKKDSSPAASTVTPPTAEVDPVGAKAIVLIIDRDANQSEVVKQVVEALKTAEIARVETWNTVAEPKSGISVTLNIRTDEALEKIKQLIEALKTAGVQQMAFRVGGVGEPGKVIYNHIILEAKPGYSIEELRRISEAIRASVKQLGLLCVVDMPKPEPENAPEYKPSDLPSRPEGPGIFDPPPRGPQDQPTGKDVGLAAAAGQLDPKTTKAQIKVFTLRFCQSTDTAELLGQLITDKSFRAVGDERTNSVVVTGTDEQLKSVEALLLKLDEVGQRPAASQYLEGYPKRKAVQARLDSAIKAQAIADSATSLEIRISADTATNNELQKQVAQLRNDYQSADKKAHQLADSLRKSPDAVKKAELQKVVRSAFALRQSLLRAELTEMQNRLLQTQQSIDMRERITDQIVDRRVEELLSPQLQWEGNPVSSNEVATTKRRGGTVAEGLANSVASPADPEAAVLARLQGAWTVQQTSEEEGKDTTGTVKAVVQGNRIRMRSLDDSNPMSFDIHFGSSGPPQQIDLHPILGPDDLAQIREYNAEAAELGSPQQSEHPVFAGIIEIDGAHVRICATPAPSVQMQRPTQFVVGPTSCIWEFRREAAVTELDGDWHRVALITEWSKVRHPTNLTIRGHQWTMKKSDGKTVSSSLVVDPQARAN